MFESDGRLTKWASKFSKLDRDEISIQVFRQNFIGESVLISYKLGAELHDRIIAFNLEEL